MAIAPPAEEHNELVVRVERSEAVVGSHKEQEVRRGGEGDRPGGVDGGDPLVNALERARRAPGHAGRTG